MGHNKLLLEGLQLFGRQNYKAAAKVFESILQENRKVDAAYNALAETYSKLGRIDEAIQTARLYTDLFPEDALAHTLLSRMYVQKGMIDEAETELAISQSLSGQNTG